MWPRAVRRYQQQSNTTAALKMSNPWATTTGPPAQWVTGGELALDKSVGTNSHSGQMQCNKQNLVVLTATLSFCALLVQQFYKLVKCNGSRICNGGVKPVETNSNLRQSENNEQNLQPTPDISFVLVMRSSSHSLKFSIKNFNPTFG